MMKTKKTKTKKPTRWKLVKKLDSVFSQYIRLKYSNPKWMCQCYTCGDIHHWKEIQNGHWLSRRYYRYRRDETNTHPQCVKCNIFLSGNQILYTRKMIDNHWRNLVDEMIDKKDEIYKVSTDELNNMIDKYKLLVEELLHHIKE